MQRESDRQSRPTPTGHEREPYLPAALATLAAPLLWALHFGFVYSLEEFLCKPPVPAAAWIPGLILVATLVCGGACAWSLLKGDGWLRRIGAAQLQSHAFLRSVQRALAALALLAIVWVGAGALFLSACVFAY